jgi:starch synthase
LYIIEKYGIDGIYLDNGFEWPELYKINEEEMYRKEYEDKSPAYSNNEIFEGEIVHNNKITGYWASKIFVQFPNPFFIRLCKRIWRKYPNFYIIAEGLELEDHDHRLISIIRSGLIPRLYKMPKALSQIVGMLLNSNG